MNISFIIELKRIILIILSVSLIFIFTACSGDSLDLANDILGSYIKKNFVYEYYVSFEATAESDYDIIEKRLESLDFEIIGKERDNGSVIYQLRTYYVEEDEYFENVCTISNFLITDENGNEIITRGDVNSVGYERTGVTVGVSESFCHELEKYFFISFVNDNRVIEGYVFTSNDERGPTVTFLTRHSDDSDNSKECQKALIYCAMFLASEPLKDAVSVNVVQSATRIFPGK